MCSLLERKRPGRKEARDRAGSASRLDRALGLARERDRVFRLPILHGSAESRLGDSGTIASASPCPGLFRCGGCGPLPGTHPLRFRFGRRGAIETTHIACFGTDRPGPSSARSTFSRAGQNRGGNLDFWMGNGFLPVCGLLVSGKQVVEEDQAT